MSNEMGTTTTVPTESESRLAGSEQVKHTPGPWSICGDGKCSCKTVMCADYPVAQVTVGSWGDDYPALRLAGTSSLDQRAEAYMEQITYGEVLEPTARANARLIAAAPDLYEALRLAMPLLESANAKCTGETAFISIARAAIAKAQGRAP